MAHLAALVVAHFQTAPLAQFSAVYSPYPALGQMEANNWLMGPIGGLTFSLGQPEKIPLTDAQPYRVTNTISDSKGNLLFYTDGHKVWDRTYRMMPHGKLLSDSLTHCLIVPKPGDPNRYYLFSTIVDGWD